MKICTTCQNTKLLVDYHVDRTAKDGRRQICKRCAIAKAIHWNVTNKDKRQAWWWAHWPEYSIRKRLHYRKNRAKRRVQRKVWYQANTEKHKELTRRWLARKPGYNVNKVRARKMQQRQAMLKCISWRHLLPVYQSAAQLTKKTGIKHHVDHIIPIKHPLVCGLHVPANLQVLSARENQEKSNQFEPLVISDPEHPWLRDLPKAV